MEGIFVILGSGDDPFPADLGCAGAHHAHRCSRGLYKPSSVLVTPQSVRKKNNNNKKLKLKEKGATERKETHGVKMERNSGGNRTVPVPGGGSGGGGGAVAPPQGYELSGKIMLCSVVVLFASVLLVLSLHLYLRWRILRRSSSSLRRRAPRLVFSGEGDAAAAAATPRGLDPAVLGSLPVIVFSHGGGGGDEEEGAAAECAVCLSEFEEGEKVRTLPRCGHRFHIQCIDMWFHSHSTCPLCRSAVERPPPPPPPPPLIAAPADECANPSSSSESGVRELRIEVGRGSEEDLGLGFGEKSPGSRIVLLRRLLSRDLRIYRGAEEADHERGEDAPLPGVAAV